MINSLRNMTNGKRAVYLLATAGAGAVGVNMMKKKKAGQEATAKFASPLLATSARENTNTMLMTRRTSSFMNGDATIPSFKSMKRQSTGSIVEEPSATTFLPREATSIVEESIEKSDDTGMERLESVVADVTEVEPAMERSESIGVIVEEKNTKQSMSEPVPVVSLHDMTFDTYGTLVLKTRRLTSSKEAEMEPVMRRFDSTGIISEMTITFNTLTPRQSTSIVNGWSLPKPLIKMQRCIP